MVNKQIELDGYGTIVINPINFSDKEYESVDIEGKPLEWVKGTTIRGHFVNAENIEVPESQVCKKIDIDGETILIQKFKPTDRVDTENIEVIEDNTEIYTAIERKPYKVFTDNKKLNKLILEENKTLKFPVVFGCGYKMYTGILTKWKGQIILCGCRGDINEVLEKYQDDAVDIVIETIPQNQQTKRLLKVFA